MKTKHANKTTVKQHNSHQDISCMMTM